MAKQGKLAAASAESRRERAKRPGIRLDGETEFSGNIYFVCAGGLRRSRRFKLLYPDEMSIKEKIEAIPKGVYLAREVSHEPLAERQI